MYMSTGFLTGLIFLGMLLIRPTALWLGRMVVVIAALLLIMGTLPRRKGLALALNYLITLGLDNPEGWTLRRGRGDDGS